MLKKIYRLGEVNPRNSKNIASDHFTFRTAKNNLEVSRFAFVVSKKIDKRAVVRNNVKRKLRSCIEEIFDKIETGNDFIFYPKPAAIGADRKMILDEIKRVFSKEGYLI